MSVKPVRFIDLSRYLLLSCRERGGKRQGFMYLKGRNLRERLTCFPHPFQVKAQSIHEQAESRLAGIRTGIDAQAIIGRISGPVAFCLFQYDNKFHGLPFSGVAADDGSIHAIYEGGRRKIVNCALA